MSVILKKAQQSDVRTTILSKSVGEFIEMANSGKIKNDHLAKGFQIHMEAAGKYGDKDSLRRLIDAGGHKYQNACHNALIAAAESGHKQAIEALVRSKAGLGKSSFDGALLAASKANWSTLIPMLVALGADVDAIDLRGDTALITTIRVGSRDSAFKLIEVGADVNAEGERGTPLIHAAERVDFEMCKLLILLGAEPNMQKFGWRALDYARDANTFHLINKWRTIKLLEQYKTSSYTLE